MDIESGVSTVPSPIRQLTETTSPLSLHAMSEAFPNEPNPFSDTGSDASAHPARRPSGRRVDPDRRPDRTARTHSAAGALPTRPLPARPLLLGGAALAGVGGAAAAAWRLRGTSGAATPGGAGSPSGAGSGVTTDQVALATGVAAAAPVALPAGLDVEHLLRRVTYGPTDALRAEVQRMGAGAWLGQQLAPTQLADPDGDRVAKLFPELNLSIAQAYTKLGKGDKAYSFQLSVALNHLGRAVWSKHQLHEVMVEFWSNHLNLTVPGDKGYKARHAYDRDVIRRFALARFEDMLVASAVHPAMLDYLDNANSTAQAPNENYARELMELHTLGVDGGYTERDVKQAAILLTGWRLEENGTAGWHSDRHASRAVTVLGARYANGRGTAGRRSAETLVRTLAHHPSTARHIARKLAIRFVSDTPSKALVDALATTYLRGNTAIGPVLRVLFGSQEFARSAGQKLRRPMERTVAVLRVLGARPPATAEPLLQVYYQLEAAGQKPMGWAMPNGYPDVAASWQSPAGALSVLNTTIGLVHGWWPKELKLPGAEKLLSRPPHSRSATIDAVARRVLGRQPTAQERSAAATLLAGTKLHSGFSTGSWDQQETAALVACLFLTSPAFLER